MVIEYLIYPVHNLTFDIYWYFLSFSVNPMDSILSMIKQGVKLRPADKDDKRSSQDLDILETPSDSHMRLLQESLSRISRFTRESSPESEEDSDEEDLFA